MNVSRIAVCGIGQMGAAAAACFGRAGFPVLLWARDAAKLAGVPDQLAKLGTFLDEHVGPAAATPGPVETTADLGRVNAAADLLLECVAEDLDQKADLFRRLAPAADRGAILASCTSGLSVSEMGHRSGTGRRLVGAHFWNPPHLMPVVEVVRGAETEDGLVEAVADVLRRAGKLPVVCKDVPGFIGNRLQHALWREAIALVQSGVCSAADVDLVARLTFGLRLPAVGPCENVDLVGLDLVAAIQGYLLADLCDHKGVMPAVDELRAAGRTGMRAGRGFYDWAERDPATLVAARDKQIVRQLAFLREVGRLG
ncbi:MAG: 3-hydroxyacyl-CoA dehydrogenase family protein [Gemmataceae bacterium]|nr:3-hydroxyacyl-CoA dehydrogenase family protein [Gemmataceae bacterium]